MLCKPAMLWGLPRARTKGRASGDRVFRDCMALQKTSGFEVSKALASRLQGRAQSCEKLVASRLSLPWGGASQGA